MDKKDRLEALIAHYTDGKPSVFAKQIGVAPSTISSWLSRNTMDYDIIFAKCESLSAEWLLRGEGPMLKAEGGAGVGERGGQGEGVTPYPYLERLIDTVREQAEEIGRLKAAVEEMRRKKGVDAPDVLAPGAASAG